MSSNSCKVAIIANLASSAVPSRVIASATMSALKKIKGNPDDNEVIFEMYDTSGEIFTDKIGIAILRRKLFGAQLGFEKYPEVFSMSKEDGIKLIMQRMECTEEEAKKVYFMMVDKSCPRVGIIWIVNSNSPRELVELIAGLIKKPVSEVLEEGRQTIVYESNDYYKDGDKAFTWMNATTSHRVY